MEATADDEERKKLTYLRTAFSSLLVTGPFSIVLGFNGGLMALNDRLKLRSMVVGEKKISFLLQVKKRQSELWNRMQKIFMHLQAVNGDCPGKEGAF